MCARSTAPSSCTTHIGLFAGRCWRRLGVPSCNWPPCSLDASNGGWMFAYFAMAVMRGGYICVAVLGANGAAFALLVPMFVRADLSRTLSFLFFLFFRMRKRENERKSGMLAVCFFMDTLRVFCRMLFFVFFLHFPPSCLHASQAV